MQWLEETECIVRGREFESGKNGEKERKRKPRERKQEKRRDREMKEEKKEEKREKRVRREGIKKRRESAGEISFKWIAS